MGEKCTHTPLPKRRHRRSVTRAKPSSQTPDDHRHHVLPFPVPHSGFIAPAILAAVCLPASDSSHTQPLPPLSVPVDFTTAEQIDLLHIHFEEYTRFLGEGIDVHFDSRNHVFENATAAMYHLGRWGNNTQAYKRDWQRRRAMLERIPEIARYRGARLRAIALGQLALSLWYRDPPARTPTLKDLRRCFIITLKPKECDYSPRTLTLFRLILTARHADLALFRRMKRQLKQRLQVENSRTEQP